MANNSNSQHGYHNSMDGSNYQRPHRNSMSGQRPEQYPPPPLSTTMPAYPSVANGYNPPPPPPYPPSSATGTKPIADAVNQAFDKSSAANELPADVIAQITEQVRSQVIDTLRKELSGAAPQSSEPLPPQRQPYPTESDTAASIHMPSAPPTQSFGPGHPFSSGPGPHIPQPNAPLYGSSPAKSSRVMHTPPTPERDADDSSYFEQSDTRERRASKLPSQDYTSSRPIPVPESSSNRTTSPVTGTSMKEDLSSRYGERTREASTASGMERPMPTRIRTNDEETVVEKMWQPLFDTAGKPTARTNQFLRGIALHMIEEFEPKNSLVIGPYKMKRYFEQMRSSDDFLPWKDIFMLPSAQLSALYSTLSCHHHLIPKSASPYETPHLAALTPHGFASFMTLLIQAYPGVEFERLSATVREWPVSNADERKERWPKELSRRLLPRSGSETDRRLLLDALRKTGVALPHSSYPPPPPNPGLTPNTGAYNYSSSAPSGFVPPPPPASAPPAHHQGSHSRSQRSNHATSSGSTRNHPDAALDNSSDESSAPSLPIERERKPYVAKEGTGKVYEEPLDRVKSASAIPPTQPPPQLSARDRSTTQSSAASTPHYIPPSASTASGPSRTRGGSISQDTYAGRDSLPHYQRSMRARSPPSAQSGYGRGSGDRVDAGGSNGSSAYYEDDRYYDRDRLDRVTSRDEDERERERRYARYDEEYRRSAGMSNTYAGGNPPLGTGERRY